MKKILFALTLAVLAAFLLSEEDDLAGFLDRVVFADAFATTVTADPGEVELLARLTLLVADTGATR
jgi:hypothetical protein